jgi:hypothetical protein
MEPQLHVSTGEKARPAASGGATLAKLVETFAPNIDRTPENRGLRRTGS